MADERPEEIDNTKYQFTADHDHDGNDIQNVRSLDTDKVSHGHDVTDTLGKKSISPDVEDVGVAVNTAISELTPEGGLIELPRGTHTISTPIDLNHSNGQAILTPVTLTGHGATRDGSNADGTTLDASGMASGPVIDQGTDRRRNVILQNFSVFDPPTDAPPFDLTGGSMRNSRLEHVVVDGNGSSSDVFAFDITAFFGGVIDSVYAYEYGRGLRLSDGNASRIGTVVVRECNNTNPAVVLSNSRGFSANLFYIESNAGGALSFVENCKAFSIDSSYFENNNGSGNADREVVFGDTQISSGGATENYTISTMSFLSAANTFGPERMTIDDTRAGNIKSIRGGPNLFATSARGDDMVYQQCGFGDVDTTNATESATWINTTMNTDNRRATYADITDDVITTGDAIIQNKLDYPVQSPSTITVDDGTWYQNTEGVPIIIYIGYGDDVDFSIHVNDSQTDNRVKEAREDNTSNAQRATLSAIVPAGDYFKVEEFAGATQRVAKQQMLGKR